MIRAIETALSFIDKRTAARAFTDDFPTCVTRPKKLSFRIRQRFILLDQRRKHICDPCHEHLCRLIAALNLHQSVLPISRELWGLDLLRHERSELYPVVCRNKLLSITLNVLRGNKLLNHSCSRSRSAKAFLLRILIESIIAGSFHRRQKCIFRVGFRRRSEVLTCRGIHRKHLPLCHDRKSGRSLFCLFWFT